MSKQKPPGHKKLVADFLKHYEENHVLRPATGKELTYEQMQAFGLLKPYAARLPITLIAELDALAQYGPWRSKQEMVYQLIRASLNEIVASEPDLAPIFSEIAQKAVDGWAESPEGRRAMSPPPVAHKGKK